jgi:hypothetical protein
MRCEIGAAQASEARFDGAGFAAARERRSSSCVSMPASTGSPAAAMLSATLSGIRLRRMRLCCAAVRLRQRSIFSDQLIGRLSWCR